MTENPRNRITQQEYDLVSQQLQKAQERIRELEKNHSEAVQRQLNAASLCSSLKVESDKLKLDLEAAEKVIARLGSSEAFHLPGSMDEETRMRIEYAREYLQKRGKNG